MLATSAARMEWGDVADLGKYQNNTLLTSKTYLLSTCKTKLHVCVRMSTKSIEKQRIL